MDNDSQLLDQYKNLWDNMQRANALNYQIVGAVIVASVTILTAGLTKVTDGTVTSINALIFLAIFTITVPGYKLLQGNRRHIWRVSTYIRVFLEPHLEYLKWETNVTHQREWVETQVKRGGQNLFSSLASANEWFIIFMLNSVATVASVILFWNTTQINSLVGAVIAIVIYVYVSVSTWRQEKNIRRGGKVEQDFYRSWIDVKNMTASSKAHRGHSGGPRHAKRE